MNINPILAKIINYNSETNKSFCPTCRLELRELNSGLRCVSSILPGCIIRFRVNSGLGLNENDSSVVSFYLNINFQILIEIYTNKNTILIYPNPNKLTTKINIPMFDLDFSNLDKLKNKINTYIKFS